MNFSTEKMAKQLDLPSKAYLVELKKQKPLLFGKLQAEYDQGFTKFFGDIAIKIKQMMAREIDIKQFIDQCQKEFQRRNDFEKELSSKRKIETLASSDSDNGILKTGKQFKAKAVGDYIWSDDETFPQSGTTSSQLAVLQLKLDALEHDFASLNIRYSQCKNALNHQLGENEILKIENERLRKENESLKKHCVCQSIEQMILKRKRE